MRKLIRYLIPPIIYWLLSLIRGAKDYIKAWNLPKVEYNSKNGKSLCVIGNGPSLKDTFENYLDILKSMDCIVVNQFSTTSYFTQLKPSAYLVVDGAYFHDPDSLPQNLADLVRNVARSIQDNLDWDMVIYLPFNAYNSYYYKTIIENKFVKVIFFNNSGWNYALPCSTFLYKLWNRNLIGHLGQTVLNTCIGLGIEMRYSNIYVVGADSSWHELYWMDQATNQLYIVDKHFYGGKKTPVFMDSEHKHQSKIHEELGCVSRALKSYWELSEYAKYNQIKVFNASSYSWIDAFERISFN